MAKRLTQGISFFTTDEMYEKIRQSSEKREISVSSLLRSLIKEFLKSESIDETNAGEVSQHDNISGA